MPEIIMNLLDDVHKRNLHTIFVKPTNESEIVQVIRKLKSNAGGVENIHTNILKKICQFGWQPLAYIFNVCTKRDYDHFV